jgi:4-coumarate--CoA ligase
VLLTHPDVADAAVIGVDSVEQATELPRSVGIHCCLLNLTSSVAPTSFTPNLRR